MVAYYGGGDITGIESLRNRLGSVAEGFGDFFRGAGPVGGRTYTFSGRWDPNLDLEQNLARANGDVKDPGRPSIGMRANKYPVPAGLAAAYESQRREPYTPNPYGVSQYTDPTTYNQGINDAGQPRRYLGGYSDDYVSKTTVPMPYGADNVSMRYFATLGKRRPVYGKPVYREGDESNYPGLAQLSVDGIRDWQAFFQQMGFRTGPSGSWTTYEMNAMRNFMTMANGVPGGGMTVETLRARVEGDIASGALLPGELAVQLGGDLNELAMDGTSGGGGTGDELVPFTQTTVQRQVQEISADQALMVLIDHMRQQVGREPTQDEISRLVKGVNAAFRADPTVITTVVTTDPTTGEVTTEETQDETDVDVGAMALRSSREDVPEEERQEYQGNRYFDALMQELGV